MPEKEPKTLKEQFTSEINDFVISSRLSSELIEDEFELDDVLKAELNSLYDEVSTKFKVGKVLNGKVLVKDSSGITVNIEYKSNGVIPNYEFSEYELEKLVIGNDVEVLLDRLEDENGVVVLSYQKAKALRAWDKISELAEADESVRGVVTHKVKGGLSVDVGIPAFLPGSQIDVQRITDFDQFVGQEVVCKILKINRKRGNVIISRRKNVEEQRNEEKKKALETIAEDQIIQGVVKNITSYGVFVDIGGIDGLLHITDMSWGRISHPSELVKIGGTISVKVISFDKVNEKISLGMKQLSENPWKDVAKKYPIEDKITGKVSSITDYGLFIEVERGIEGLVHISEISWTERIRNLSDKFSVGDSVEAVIVALDQEERRMSLSIKKLNKNPWETVMESFKIGDKITGKVSNITDFGVFVQVLNGVDGLIHISDLSWTDHVSHPSEKFKKGDEINVIILGIDPEHRKISLGIKQLEKDPWKTVAEQYIVGNEVEGIVSKITTFGAFVKLPSGIEGLVHISELADKEVENIDEILKIGDKKTFKIIKVRPEDRKIGLSLRSEKAIAEDVKKQEELTKKEKPKKVVAQPSDNERKKVDFKQNVQKFENVKKDQIKGSLQQALEEHMKKQDKEEK
jgi:small subunit ribosomal protein S1